MRKYKFRLWNTIDEVMIYCVYSPRLRNGWLQPDPEDVLIEWTGLIDKNKKDVYDGDIIKWNDIIFSVSWSKEDCGFICSNKSPSAGSMNQEYISHFEIIGHIFQEEYKSYG